MSQEIPDKLFFKIGEVAEVAEVEQHVLRYWEDEFEILKPGKNRSGQRLYQRKDVELVLSIKDLLYNEKYTLAGAKQKLKTAKKNSAQLNFVFDRVQFLDWKKRTKKELKSILKILDGKKV